MSRLATSFVLGYHGCDKAVGTRAIQGDIELNHSNRDFDWLGPGTYFWESDPHRAMKWAEWRASKGDYSDPFVVGAVIDLGNCLDLTSRDSLQLVREAHESLVEIQSRGVLTLPENKSAPGDSNEDRVLRFLDCAVIRHLHQIIAKQPPDSRTVEPFDTVRGIFTEGGALYPGAKIHSQTHVQIAVVEPSCIKGLFLPRPYPAV